MVAVYLHDRFAAEFASDDRMRLAVRARHFLSRYRSQRFLRRRYFPLEFTAAFAVTIEITFPTAVFIFSIGRLEFRAAPRALPCYSPGARFKGGVMTFPVLTAFTTAVLLHSVVRLEFRAACFAFHFNRTSAFRS